jgi:hypothetical protein
MMWIQVKLKVCILHLLLRAIKKNSFIFQTVAAIAAKQRVVGLHISYVLAYSMEQSPS